MQQVRLPPYGKTLYNIHSQGLIFDQDIYIFMGREAWQKAKYFQPIRPTTMCLPTESESPYNYLWPVQDCTIMLFDTSFSEKLFVQNFVECLLSYGATVIWFVSTDFQLTIYQKEF